MVVVEPGSNTIKAAPYLCICSECANKYGSCKLFQEYTVTVQNVPEPSVLRSATQPEVAEATEDDIALEFVAV